MKLPSLSRRRRRKKKRNKQQGTSCITCTTKMYRTEQKCDLCVDPICNVCSNWLHEDGKAYVLCDTCYAIVRELPPPVEKPAKKSKFNWPIGRPAPYGKLPVYKPKPRHRKYTDYMSTPNPETFEPSVTEEVFWQMTGWLLETPHAEIAGAFVYDEEKNEIVWAHRDAQADMLPGHVNSGRGEATALALASGWGVPNGQFHTHPGFGSFFSGEDDSDQAEFVYDAAKLSPNGSQIFIVFDQLSWRVTKAVWKDGKPFSRESGYVRCGDHVLNFRSFRKIVYKKGAKVAQSTTVLLPSSTETKQYSHVREPQQPALPTLEAPAPLPDTDRWLFVGSWSDDDMDYQELFSRFNVPLGKWRDLYNEINASYGFAHYQNIVENRDIWEVL